MTTCKAFLTYLLLASSWTAYADIPDAVRQSEAVVLYDFSETSGNVIYDKSTKGTPLNLTLASMSGVYRYSSPSALEFTQNMISSSAPAKKIYDACTASKEMTIEVWLENGGSAEFLSGGYPDEDTHQPLRIVTMSSGLNKTNFALGQFYDGMVKNHYMMGVKTNNSNAATAFLNNAITTNSNELILPSMENDKNAKKMQKVIFTLSAKSQIASLYLSDRNGNLYPSQSTSNGFTSNNIAQYFSGWDANARLVLGNEFLSNPASQLAVNYEYRKCDDDLIAKEPNCASPNRYWRGKLYMVAIYCKAFTREEIFGTNAYSIVQNPVFDIDVNLKITPNLQKAQQIHQRLTGIKTPIANPILGQMEKLLDAADPVGAAGLATQEPGFYNITVRDFASKMSVRDETINTPLNDFTATIIGGIRDNINAKSLLTDNIVYMADSAKAAVPSDMVNDVLKSNNHYLALDSGRYDLSKVLVAKTQKVFDGKVAVDNPTPAGLLTTRQWVAAHAVAGTNRRLVEFSFRQFLCKPLENVADSSGPDNVIGRDIDRFPGGSHTKFTTTCRACHTVMDGFRPAFSQITFNNNVFMHTLVYPSTNSQANEDMGTGVFVSKDPGASFVVSKMNHNETVFPGGMIVTSTAWVNNANYGANQSTFGWTKLSGTGVRDFGQMLSESKQFPVCMAERVFKTICKRDPASSDSTLINQAAQEFATTRNYNLRYLFQKIVTSQECLGGN